jgi:hypothetical protein
VVTAFTSNAGGRNVTPVTIVPSRTRSVRPARKPRVVSLERPGVSGPTLLRRVRARGRRALAVSASGIG